MCIIPNMLLFILIIVIAALVVYIFIHHQRQNTVDKNTRVETLKNALLSYALSEVKKDDFDDWNSAYQTFDGTKLPSMSGCSPVNAYTSYIIDKGEFRKYPFYTHHMESKLDAIEKYLNMQFDTDAKVIDFMEAFIKKE
jgi:hypothetical protein